MSDIILVRASDKSMPHFKKIGAVQPPMNLVYLATYLREHGYRPEIVDLEVKHFTYLVERLKLAKPYLVGVSVMTPNISEAKQICELCRSLGILTVLGGPHPTALPEQTLKYTNCDYVVVGEGELPLYDLLKSIIDRQSIVKIKGIAFLGEDILVLNERPPLINIDELPLPDRRFLDLDLYSGETTPGIVGNSTVMFTSRGCPYGCTFCASKIINQQRVRFRSMEKIYEEIDDIVSLGYNHITVEDDTLTLKKQRVKNFCSYLISEYPQLSWDCDSRVDTIDDELLYLMRKSNCKKIAFGVESGSSKILKSIGKRITVNNVINAFKLTKKHKILTQAFFMIGFPDETIKDIESTEELIYKIKPDFLFLSLLVPFPGTFAYDYMLDKGLLVLKGWDSYVFFGDKISWRTEHFCGDELVRIRNRISRSFYFNPSYIIRKILHIRDISQLFYLIKGSLVAFRSFHK